MRCPMPGSYLAPNDFIFSPSRHVCVESKTSSHPILACLYLMMNGKECSFADSRAAHDAKLYFGTPYGGVNFPACCWCKYSGKLTEPPPTNTYRYTHGTVPWLLLLFGLLCWFTGLQSTHHLRRKWTLRKVSREGCILEVGACPEW